VRVTSQGHRPHALSIVPRRRNGNFAQAKSLPYARISPEQSLEWRTTVLGETFTTRFPATVATNHILSSAFRIVLRPNLKAWLISPPKRNRPLVSINMKPCRNATRVRAPSRAFSRPTASVRILSNMAAARRAGRPALPEGNWLTRRGTGTAGRFNRLPQLFQRVFGDRPQQIGTAGEVFVKRRRPHAHNVGHRLHGDTPGLRSQALFWRRRGFLARKSWLERS
jgi:hypothetical protein